MKYVLFYMCRTIKILISVAESQTFLLAKRPQRRGARRKGCFRSLDTQMNITAVNTKNTVDE